MTTDNDSTTPQNHTQDTPTRRKRENATIIRAAHSETGKFFLLVRATAQDHRLSPEALGVLVELLSRSDDWVVQVTQLSKRHKLGREKCYRILKELTAAGYMVRTMVRDDHGKVVRVEYVVHEVSQGEAEPLPEKPDTAKQEAEKPNTENPDTEKQHITDTRIAQETESTSMPTAKAAATNGAKPTPKPRKRNAMFDAIVMAFGYDSETLTKNESSLIGTVAAQLTTAQVTPEDVASLYAWCKRQGWKTWGPGALTTNVSNWRKTARPNQTAHPASDWETFA